MKNLSIDAAFLSFGLKVAGMYIVWYLIYDVWVAPVAAIDQFLNESVAKGGYFLLQKFGFEVCRDGTSVCVNNVSTVIIGRGCNGLEIYAIFAGFILLYKGPWIHKIWFIPAGICIIYVSNIMRVAMLAMDKYKNYHLFQFNHKYTYVFVMYFLVFVMWLFWINKWSHASKSTSD